MDNAIINKNILDVQVERTNFAATLEESRKLKEFTDVQLQIGDQLFDAHRNVLAANSPVLKAAISDQWSTTKVCPISDQYVDPSIVEPLLHFLYTGSIQLTPDNVHPVCVAAHFLQIPTLLEPSVKHLCELVTVENVLQLFEFSVTCQLEPLRYSCLEIIRENHRKAFKDPAILKFSSRIFNDLILGLKDHSKPGTILKESTFDCIVRWTEVNLSERSDKLPGLLKNIPLEKLSLKFFTKTVFNHRLVKESISCRQTVFGALANIEFNMEPERDDNLVVFGHNGEVSCYDTQTKTWKDLPSMLESRFNFASTVVNRKDIVVCGGTNKYYGTGFRHLDTVEMFEWAPQSWKQLPRMPFPISICTMASLDDKLFVIGKEPGEGSDEIVCYSFETQQWQSLKPMNNAQNYDRLIAFGNYLYVFSGQESVKRYDPISDEWTIIDDIPELLRHGTVSDVTVNRNKLYISIFANQKYFIEEFDPETNAWTRVSETVPEGFLGSLNGRLVISKFQTNWIYELNSANKHSFLAAYLGFFQSLFPFFKPAPQSGADPAKWTKFLELNSNACRFVTGAFY